MQRLLKDGLNTMLLNRGYSENEPILVDREAFFELYDNFKKTQEENQQLVNEITLMKNKIEKCYKASREKEIAYLEEQKLLYERLDRADTKMKKALGSMFNKQLNEKKTQENKIISRKELLLRLF